VSSRTNSLRHSSFCIVIAPFLVVVASVSINGIGLSPPPIALAQQQPQANLTFVEQQQLMEGISFEIDNVL
jgi:hypothetical protein